ncbi:MAG: ATP-dependent zinc metalloprotease FtsH [Microgenomates group bacterium]
MANFSKISKKNNKIKKIELKFKFNLKNVLIWLFFLWLGLSFLISLRIQEPGKEKIPLSQALQDIKEGRIEKVEVEDSRLYLTYKDGRVVLSQKESGVSFAEILKSAEIPPQSVNFIVKELPISTSLLDLLATLLPAVLMIFFFIYLFRQAKGAQESIFSFGKSTAKIFAKGKQSVTFADVAGVDEAKKELEEVVDFLKHPEKYRRLGARTPKGVLLVGPSGCGKTLLAKAVAGEAGVPFFSAAGSEFMEMLVGVGPARIRDLFAQAKKAAPSIIFIDEIDAIGRQRGLGFTSGHDEREQTLNQILVEMDGFTPADNVVVIAATNRPDILDPALVRPGRFDRRVVVDLPDLEDRKAILQIHARGKIFEKDVDWDQIARATVGFSGADLENMLNEAAILAARNNRKAITKEDINEAALKVKLGPEKKRLQSEEEKRMTAYHEAGHAVVSYYLPHMDPVARVSIVSRGLALGFTLIPPQKDRYHETKTHLEETIVSLLGGRAAEEIVFKELTAGAASDIDKATKIARQMVVDLGMSRLGPIYLGPQIEEGEWGKSWWQPAEISPQMAAKVDEEIKRIVDEAYQKALSILKKSRKKLDLVAKTLLEKETIEQEEFMELMKKNENSS